MLKVTQTVRAESDSTAGTLDLHNILLPWKVQEGIFFPHMNVCKNSNGCDQ